MWIRVETSRVGPARLPSAASWRGSSSFAYRIHWRSGRSGGDDAHLSENTREFVWGERVTQSEYSSMLTRRHTFHARYGEFEATIDIDTQGVIQGELPRRALNLVQEWAMIHREELLEDWRLC